MSGQRVGYVRVSTLDQNTVRQLDGIPVDKTYTERASGKDQKNRPELENLIGFVREGDTVLVHSMDRLARNLDDLKKIVGRLTRKGVRVEFVKEALTFTGDDSAAATLLLHVMGAFAEFERSLIRERQREGIALAKQRKVYKGRVPALNPERAAELRRRAAEGESKTNLARDLGISRATVYTYLRTDDETNLIGVTSAQPADERPRSPVEQRS
ncbi:recombinase family protein [Microbacterium sp. KRD174]